MKKIDLSKPIIGNGEAKSFQSFLLGFGLGKNRMPGSKIGRVLSTADDTEEKLSKLSILGGIKRVPKNDIRNLNTTQSDSGISVRVGYMVTKKTIEIPTLEGVFKLEIDYTSCLDMIPKEFHNLALQLFAFEAGIEYEESVISDKKVSLMDSIKIYFKNVNAHLNIM